MSGHLFSHEANIDSKQDATCVLEFRRTTMNNDSRKAIAIGFGLSCLCVLLSGCGIGGSTAIPVAPGGTPGAALQGKVYGGQQPIINASIYLYAAGSTGYGSAYMYATNPSLLGNNKVTTGAGGVFSITGDYTCPASNPNVYIEADGGVPVAGQAANNNIIMLAALGPCKNLSSATYITMNELTTVASVWALAPFMTGPTNIGTSSKNAAGLNNAFATVNTLVSIQDGTINTTSLPAGATLPTAELNTLADIVAACVNTPGGGVANDGLTACGTLFGNATPPGGTPPTDTMTAAMNIAHYPGQNVAKLAALATKTAPFQDVETSVPTDWTVSIRYTGNGNLSASTAPAGIAADQSGNIWIANLGTVDAAGTAYTTEPSLVELSPTGTFLQAHAEAAYLGVAIDLNGNAWSSFKYLDETTSGAAGVTTAYNYNTAAKRGGLTSGDIPSLAVDGSNNIWATSSATDANGDITSSALAEFTNAGVAKSPAGGYTGGGLFSGVGVAITPH
jgi:hypothetical protein